MEVAFQAVKEDVWPLTSEVKEAEEYLLEENHSMAAVEQVVVVGDLLEVLVLTEVEVVVQPFHDASHDVEDDE